MADQASNPDLEMALAQNERRTLEERLRPSAALVYEIVRQEGDQELARPATSLAWSGVAAGLSIAMSIVATGAFVAFVPDATWSPLVTSFGYTIGFLIVILGRQQLFTENTLTVVLPVMAAPRLRNVVRLGRLWVIVLASNVVGASTAGVVLGALPLVPPVVHTSIGETAGHLFELQASDMFWRAIIAGWLIAAMVWLLPTAEANAPLVIILITYLIALADLTHVIVGSVEAAFLVSTGELGVADGLFRFFLPTLLGNVLGGTALFAVISYAQVREEMMSPAAD